MLTERQLLILETIIRDYTNLDQPIGSKTLQQQLPVHVSTATIRNEMAALEKLGFIMKEHSSSGRIPSIKGYRYYVDNMIKPATVDSNSLKGIQNFFGTKYHKVDELIEMSAGILSDLTNYTTIALKPEKSDLTLQGFRMVPLENGQVMVILVASDGTVESQVYNIPVGIDGEAIESVISLINDQLVGLPLKNLTSKLLEILPHLTKYLQDPNAFIDVFGDVLNKAISEQFYVGGKRNLLNNVKNDNIEQIKSLYSLVDKSPGKIEEIVDNSKKLKTGGNSDISVAIGDELTNQLLLDYSVISAKYDVGNFGKGVIAILGPTNMPYSKMIGILGAFQEELTKKLVEFYKDFNSSN